MVDTFQIPWPWSGAGLWVSLYLLLSSLGERCVLGALCKYDHTPPSNSGSSGQSLAFLCAECSGCCELSVCPLRGSTCCLSGLTQAMNVGTGPFH